MIKKIITQNSVLVIVACASFFLSVLLNIGNSWYTADSATSHLLWVVFFEYLSLSAIILLSVSLIILLILKLKNRKPAKNYIKYGYIILAVIMIAELAVAGACYRHEDGFIDGELPSEYRIVLAPYKDKASADTLNTFYHDDYKLLGNRYSCYSADIEYIGTADTGVTYEVFSASSKKNYLQFIAQNTEFQANLSQGEKTDCGNYTTAKYTSSDGQWQHRCFAIYDNQSKIIICSVTVDVGIDSDMTSEDILIEDDEIIECLINQFKEIGNDSPHHKEIS